MALDKDRLGLAMATAVGTQGNSFALADMKALAQAIILEITGHATISVSTTIQVGTVATGVTAGAAAVPVTGTATGTATIT